MSVCYISQQSAYHDPILTSQSIIELSHVTLINYVECISNYLNTYTVFFETRCFYNFDTFCYSTVACVKCYNVVSM